MGEVPESHPRYASLMARKMLTDAAAAGMLADSALIAHGRGEAFDYLLGEETCEPARKAIVETVARLQSSEKCVISVNGNTVALAGPQLIACAAVLNCPIEVNIYYRTPERMDALLSALQQQRLQAMELFPELSNQISNLEILGGEPDGRIPNLEGPRANCHSNGILSADTILVPLEDGDRCEALIAMGKTICVIDLNPLSRTAHTATVTIVDELTRCVQIMLEYLRQEPAQENTAWDNEANLQDVIEVILRRFE
jgi:4-phosphopantoate--beta-alanine ligase